MGFNITNSYEGNIKKSILPNKRNGKYNNEKIVMYLSSKITAYEFLWEEYNDKKERWENKKEVNCHLYNEKFNPNLVKHRSLTLG